MKTFKQATAESTCLKRVTVCELYAADGTLLARESNRCDPPDGKCQRIAVSNQQAEYPESSTCNWTHSESMALQAVGQARPTRAVIYGHDFPCPSCERALRVKGVTAIEVVPAAEGCGLSLEEALANLPIQPCKIRK